MKLGIAYTPLVVGGLVNIVRYPSPCVTQVFCDIELAGERWFNVRTDFPACYKHTHEQCLQYTMLHAYHVDGIFIVHYFNVTLWILEEYQ